MIAKANPKATDTDWFTSSTLAASTYNKRLSYLRAFGRWLVSQGLTDPFGTLKPRKGNREPPKPFNSTEIALIIKGFSGSPYLPFVRFLLATGVRPSEGVGLQWKHLDFERSEITISESLSRDRAGNGYQKVRKQTKTGQIRYLPMSEPLRAILLAHKPTKVDPDTLVFQSPRGLAIHPATFRHSYWKPVLEKAGIAYRCPYNCRHSFASHCIQQGIPLTGVAYLLGHKDTQLVMRVYGHMVDKPELPEMYLG